MTRNEQATQVWPILVLSARNQQILSYSTIGRLIKAMPVSMGKILDPIQKYCEHHKLPPLTAIAVNEATGLPGEGFTAAKIEEIFEAQARVFVFNWFNQETPSPEDFSVL
jgi:hypothetical protein